MLSKCLKGQHLPCLADIQPLLSTWSSTGILGTTEYTKLLILSIFDQRNQITLPYSNFHSMLKKVWVDVWSTSLTHTLSCPQSCGLLSYGSTISTLEMVTISFRNLLLIQLEYLSWWNSCQNRIVDTSLQIRKWVLFNLVEFLSLLR